MDNIIDLIMIDQLFGGQIYGGIPKTPQMWAMFMLFVIGWIVAGLFSFVPMSDTYPGYAFKSGKQSAIGWWTGFAFGVTMPIAVAVFKT